MSDVRSTDVEQAEAAQPIKRDRPAMPIALDGLTLVGDAGMACDIEGCAT